MYLFQISQEFKAYAEIYLLVRKHTLVFRDLSTTGTSNKLSSFLFILLSTAFSLF